MREPASGRSGERRVSRGDYYRSALYVCVWVHNTVKSTKSCLKAGAGRRVLRKNNIDQVNLIKVHYMHIVNITITPCAQFICGNKFF
jgi:transposase